MKIVLDTNIIFSFFWKDSFTKKLILNSKFELFAPKYALEEIKKYKQEIISKTSISNNKFDEVIREIKSVIKFVNRKDYLSNIGEAEEVAPDKKDSDFIALCIKLNCSLWTNDVELKNQNRIKTFSTAEIISIL